MLLALAWAARVSEISFIDIKYLVKYWTSNIFQFGKNTTLFERRKLNF